MSTTHVVRFSCALTSAHKLGTDRSVDVAVDLAGTSASRNVYPGDRIAEVVSAENDENGFPMLQTVTLWEVKEVGVPWEMLPKPKVGDQIVGVGDSGTLTGTSGVFTERGLVRNDVSLPMHVGLMVNLGALSAAVAALDERVTDLEGP